MPVRAGKAAPADAVIARWGTDRLDHAEQYYFVPPDRFANGDTRNDRGGLAGDRLKTGYDPADKGFYHGGDLAGVIDDLDYIQGLGTTAIWLAPVFGNRPVQGAGTDISAGYHGYWITDFTRVDPHFGANADLKRLVTLAHRRGMKIYLDIIVNHTADVLQYAQNKYDYIDKATAPYRDAQGRPFEDRNYADGGNGFPRVSTASFPYTPVFPTAADRTVKVPAWLNTNASQLPTFLGNHDPAHPLYRTIASLAALRRAHPALREGVQITRYAAAGAGVFAVSRLDPDKRNEYVVAANNATTAQTVTLGTWSPGATFRGVYGGNAAVAAAADGKLTVTVPALSTVVLRADTPVAVPSAGPSVTLTSPSAGALVPPVPNWPPAARVTPSPP